MIEQLIAEATECDFKVALEIKKPKSWLKSVSAFSNGIGGTLFFGVSDDRKPIGLSDVQKDAEAISRLIKERITPLPQFILPACRSRYARDCSSLSHRTAPYFSHWHRAAHCRMLCGTQTVVLSETEQTGAPGHPTLWRLS